MKLFSSRGFGLADPLFKTNAMNTTTIEDVLKITKAQQTVIDLQNKYGKLKFIAWGLNYFRVMDSNNEWVGGRVRFETFDALVRKNLLK